jgi:prevent-host-death family protein
VLATPSRDSSAGDTVVHAYASEDLSSSLRTDRLVYRLVERVRFLKEVGAFEAKTHLPELLNRVAQGERVTITRRGKPVALLVPVELPPALSPAQAVQRLRQLRQGVTWGEGVSLREAIEEGRT